MSSVWLTLWPAARRSATISGRHAQLLRRDQVEADVVVTTGSKTRKRMHRAAVFQIADHADMHAVDAALSGLKFLADGVEVQQRLGRMFINAVAAVDHRHAARFRELGHRTGRGMTHDDDVAIAADDPRGVVKRFPPWLIEDAPISAVSRTCPAEHVEGAAEADPGAGAWFEEHVAEDGAVERLAHLFSLRERLHTVGHVENPLDIRRWNCCTLMIWAPRKSMKTFRKESRLAISGCLPYYNRSPDRSRNF